jgi:hypothetical protein
MLAEAAFAEPIVLGQIFHRFARRSALTRTIGGVGSSVAGQWGAVTSDLLLLCHLSGDRKTPTGRGTQWTSTR